MKTIETANNKIKLELNEKGYYKLDPSLKSDERVILVDAILAHLPKAPSQNYLSILADYIVNADKDYRKESITDNRLVTIRRREISMEGMIEAYQSDSCNGEETIMAMLNRRQDKNIIFRPKVSITEDDIAEIPHLKQLRESIDALEEQFKKATDGKQKYSLKKNIIDLRKDQYVLKNSYCPKIWSSRNGGFSLNEEFKFDEYEDIEVKADGQIIAKTPYNFFNINYTSAFCQNYDTIKSWVEGSNNIGTNLYYSFQEFQSLVDILQERNPLYHKVLLLKSQNYENVQIRDTIKAEFDTLYAAEYYSLIWRKKLPKLLCEYATEKFLMWYYTYKEKGNWKTCNKCGTPKLRMERFFSRNKSSKDGFYSICKECRHNKYIEKKGKE